MTVIVVSLKKNFKHFIEVAVDRMAVREDARARLQDSVESALHVGQGRMIVSYTDGEEKAFSDRRVCTKCGISYPELEPQIFSFNSPLGMCPDCNGIGTTLEIDPGKVVPDESLSIREGAIVLWRGRFNEDRTGWASRFTKGSSGKCIRDVACVGMPRIRRFHPPIAFPARPRPALGRGGKAVAWPMEAR